MAVSEPVFFDTSVLVSGLIELGSENDPAQRIFNAVADGLILKPQTGWHCCLEFYSVSTRLPLDLRISPADALRLIEEEILARCRVFQVPATVWHEFLRQAARDTIAGGRIYDMHIAEIARTCGAEIVVTANTRHFSSLLRHGIRVLSPEEFSRLV